MHSLALPELPIVDVLLDSLNFHRIGASEEGPQIADSYHDIVVVDASGTIFEMPCRHVCWADVIAYRAPDLSSHVADCTECGELCEISFEGPDVIYDCSCRDVGVAWGY